MTLTQCYHLPGEGERLAPGRASLTVNVHVDFQYDVNGCRAPGKDPGPNICSHAVFTCTDSLFKGPIKKIYTPAKHRIALNCTIIWEQLITID